MALYARLIGRDDAGERVQNRIPGHLFPALMAEFARGRLTGSQAQTAIEAQSGAPLDTGEVAEAQALLATINGNGATKLARAKEIEDVLLLGENNVAEYDRPVKVKARLGV